VRILHVSSLYPPALVGGGERVVALLAEAQAEAGHEVHVSSLTREPQPPAVRNGVATRPVASRNPLWIGESAGFPTLVRLMNKTATVFNFVTASQFGSLIREIRPDVVHSHSLVEWSPLIWSEAARAGVPVLHTLHDYDLLCIRGTLFKDGAACAQRHRACTLLSAPKRALHDRIGLVASVSRQVLDTHLQYGLFGHLPEDRRRVVWNPVALDDPRPRVASADGGFRFGFLGRIVEEKGIRTLIEAARLLPPGGWTLELAGAGRDRAMFEELARGLPVRFLGHVDPAGFLSGIDTLVCLPLWDEPFGLTTVEAYAACCRVIGSNRGALGEIVEGADPGWTLPPGDPVALAALMQRAMAEGPAGPSRPEFVTEMLERLRPDAVAEEYHSLYQTLLDDCRQAAKA